MVFKKNRMPFLFVFLATIFSSCASSQSTDKNDVSDFSIEDHISSLREHSNEGKISTEDTTYKFLIDYTIGELLEKKEHVRYLTDRRLLRKLKNRVCFTRYAEISDTLLSGKRITIEIRAKSHNIDSQAVVRSESNFFTKVNGKHPYGAMYQHGESYYVENIKLKVDGRNA